MFCVSEAQAATIRTAFEQRGELSVELRRLFSGHWQHRVGPGVRPHHRGLATAADEVDTSAALSRTARPLRPSDR
jgi:hypothetical protein